jgi:hypothetical protein
LFLFVFCVFIVVFWFLAAVVKALQRHLQYTISYHPLIISILNHTFLENHELMAQEALRQCTLFVGAIQAVEAEELKELVTSPTVTAYVLLLFNSTIFVVSKLTHNVGSINLKQLQR